MVWTEKIRKVSANAPADGREMSSAGGQSSPVLSGAFRLEWNCPQFHHQVLFLEAFAADLALAGLSLGWVLSAMT